MTLDTPTIDPLSEMCEKEGSREEKGNEMRSDDKGCDGALRKLVCPFELKNFFDGGTHAAQSRLLADSTCVRTLRK